jgi:uncharacterized DUF497 family protein
MDVYTENIQFMIDLRKVIGFDWDEGNARKSQDKHAVTQAEAEQVFFNEPLLLLQDEEHGKKEVGYMRMEIPTMDENYTLLLP